MMDIMPAPHLIFNEWDKHGTCSGLSPRAYFDTIRKARQVVKVPPQYFDLKQALTVSPAEIEDAFIRANPTLAKDDMAIGCSRNWLSEVRSSVKGSEIPCLSAGRTAKLPARSPDHAARAWRVAGARHFRLMPAAMR